MGGAERMLCRLLSFLDRERFEPHGLSLAGDDEKLSMEILNAIISQPDKKLCGRVEKHFRLNDRRRPISPCFAHF
jgi:hypothetical protein